MCIQFNNFEHMKFGKFVMYDFEFFLFCIIFEIYSLDYTITINESNVTQTIPSPFYGFTIDWWKSDDPTWGPKWGNAGFLTLNLSNPNLIALTKAISPAILRIGGTPQDSIIYNMKILCFIQF